MASKENDIAAQNKEALIEERSQAEAELSRLREYMQDEVDIDPEEGDTAVSEREKNTALISVLERKVADIDAALQSMEKGEYGICTRCNEPIEPERLEFKPDATFCVSCQREIERLSRRGR